jgi:hypothetical protein
MDVGLGLHRWRVFQKRVLKTNFGKRQDMARGGCINGCNMDLNNLYCSANIVLARLKELRHMAALGICIGRHHNYYRSKHLTTVKASILVIAIWLIWLYEREYLSDSDF